ncbi:ABC transporter ATP-binding protein [Clostridium sp. 'deep sea']|uniref:ABC transporter ATP-binding protein n=1 Tax=Clostridium sp. 'deep sea' TaxID=2779445 RepID=UPI0018965F5F|nr:ABC transporter ATP-binding protein [Clostridium sp. 'deep sea']QOR36881.1 ABC transporter ATP-binding protein [Clostridium sp. 'deep sea']
MKRIFKAYSELLRILYSESPFVVISIFGSAIITGVVTPISVWVNSQILNLGLAVASGNLEFVSYVPYLILFVVLALLPVVVGDLFNSSYIRPRCELIIRTAYKGKMLQKLKKLRYEHLENEASMKIIDNVYRKDNGAEEAASNMSRIYLRNLISSTIASIGILYIIASIKWWLLLTILLPFALDTYISLKFSQNIYSEMKKFWKKDRQYGILGKMLMSRGFIRENILLGASRFLIDTYRKRFALRNREYEHYFIKHMRQKLLGKIIISIAQIVNAAILLRLYLNGSLSIGIMISLTLVIFSGLFNALKGVTDFFQSSGLHIITFEFYEKYFALSEDEYGDDNDFPAKMTIEFDDVHFTYPGTEKKVLNGLSFKINHGEKVSIVGENGEGKTTMIKLLLGLFQPDSGKIRIGGKPLNNYSQNVRRRLFGPIFQDFIKYSMTIGENVGMGDIANIDDNEAIITAMRKAKVDTFAKALADGTDTLLGRDFEGGVDLSGGQWQRIAIARAFMGNKPILILDEPTSQLDPMAESRIYSEFAEMSKDRTAIFITHRLASTVITDHIFVIANGRVALSGSHDELMKQGGLYADMFNSQKQWYIKSEEKVEHA